MKTQFTNSRGENISMGQFVFRTAVYGIASVLGFGMVIASTILVFCM